MTTNELEILNKHGIYYDEDINMRQGIFDMLNPHVFYTDGFYVNVLDYGKYIRVRYSKGFWAGFFGCADYINIKVHTPEELENTLSYIDTLKDN